MVQVDNDVFVESLTSAKVDELLEELKDKPWGTRSRQASFTAAGNRRY
jgi:hypothetical protein